MANGYYSMMLQLRGRRCVIAGGGKIAERKLRGMLQSGADQVFVIAPFVTDFIEEQASAGKVQLERREYRAEDASEAFLLFAATNDKALNKQIAEEGRRFGALVQTADDAEGGDFITPSVVRRGDLVLTVTASGASPALSKLLRRELEELYGERYAVWTERLGELRRLAYATLQDEPKEIVHDLLRLAAEEAAALAKQEQSELGNGNSSYTENFDIGEWLARLRHQLDRRHIQ